VDDRCLEAILLALFLAVAVSACDWGNEAHTGAGPPSGGTTTARAAEPTIESSLEGVTQLPSRIAWSATTSLPPDQIKAVKFLVDGDRWWEDTTVPYTYGPAGAYLPAQWISSLATPPSFHPRRKHEFAILIQGTDGETWDSAPLSARTPSAAPSPRPPGGFRGRYEFLRLSHAELANPLPPGKSPSFAHFLIFRGPSLFVRGGRHDAAWEVSGTGSRLKLGTPIFLAVGADAAAGSNFNGFGEILCATDGPPATYAWSATRGRVLFEYAEGQEYARNLELRAVKEPCAARRELLEGTWEGFLPG
jgi:hypothetical protein